MSLSYREGISYEEREAAAETLINDIPEYIETITPVAVPVVIEEEAEPVVIEEPEPVVVEEPAPVIIEEPEVIEEPVLEETEVIAVEEDATETEAVEEAETVVAEEPAASEESEPVIIEEPEPLPAVFMVYDRNGVSGSIEAADGYGTIVFNGVSDEEAAAFLEAEAEKYGVTGAAYSIEGGRAYLTYPEGLSYEVRKDAAETLVNDIPGYVETIAPVIVPVIAEEVAAATEEEGTEEKGIHSVSIGFSPWGYEYYDFYNAPDTDNDEFRTYTGFGLMLGYEARVLDFLAVGAETGYYGYFPKRSILPEDSYYWSVPVLARAALLIGNEDIDFRVGVHAGAEIAKLNEDMGMYFMFGIDFGFDFHVTEDVSVFWRVSNSMTLQPHPEMEILDSNTYIVHPAKLGVTYHI